MTKRFVTGKDIMLVLDELNASRTEVESLRRELATQTAACEAAKQLWNDTGKELAEKEREIARLRTHTAVYLFRFLVEHTHGLVTVHLVGDGWVKANCADCGDSVSTPMNVLEGFVAALTPPERKP